MSFVKTINEKLSTPEAPNSEVRALVGFEHELFTDATLGLQYYVERIQTTIV